MIIHLVNACDTGGKLIAIVLVPVFQGTLPSQKTKKEEKEEEEFRVCVVSFVVFPTKSLFVQATCYQNFQEPHS